MPVTMLKLLLPKVAGVAFCMHTSPSKHDWSMLIAAGNLHVAIVSRLAGWL
jgi:hypothetical protein